MSQRERHPHSDWLAHVSSADGVLAVQLLKGRKGKQNLALGVHALNAASMQTSLRVRSLREWQASTESDREPGVPKSAGCIVV